MLKKPIKKKKQVTHKKEIDIDIYDADHPLRRTAIEIIENLIEPLLNRGINGKKYYDLEDNLTLTMEKRLNKLLIKPIKADITKTNPKKLDKTKNNTENFSSYLEANEWNNNCEEDDCCEICGEMLCMCD